MTTLCMVVGFNNTLIHKTCIDIKFNLKQSVCDLYITKLFWFIPSLADLGEPKMH